MGSPVLPHVPSFAWRTACLPENGCGGALVSGRMLAPLRAPFIGRSPHLGSQPPSCRVRRDARARAGQRVRPAAGVAAALVPDRLMDLRGRSVRAGGPRRRLLGRTAALHRLHRPRPRGRDRVRRRDRDPRQDARPRRREPGGGHRRRRGVRDRRALRRGARRIIRTLQETAHEWAVHNFTSGCEVADMLVQRLEFSSGVRDALACTFERWNGTGFPAHAAARPFRLPCASCTSATTWRRSAASSRPSAPWRLLMIAATGPTIRRSRTCSSSTVARGSTGSASSSRGTPSWPSSPNPIGCSTRRHSTGR